MTGDQTGRNTETENQNHGWKEKRHLIRWETLEGMEWETNKKEVATTGGLEQQKKSTPDA